MLPSYMLLLPPLHVLFYLVALVLLVAGVLLLLLFINLQPTAAC